MPQMGLPKIPITNLDLGSDWERTLTSVMLGSFCIQMVLKKDQASENHEEDQEAWELELP